jgi:hypothetical protein
LRWTWLVAMTAAVVVAWAVWTTLSRRPRARRWLGGGALVGLTVLSGVNAVAAARAGTPQEEGSQAIAALAPRVVAALPGGEGGVIVRGEGFRGFTYASGLLLELERRGVQARSDQFDERSWGDHRIHDRGRVRARFTVATNEDFDERVADPGVGLVGYWGTMSRQDRARRVDQVAELDRTHERGTIGDEAWLDRRRSLLPDDEVVVGVFAESVPPVAG